MKTINGGELMNMLMLDFNDVRTIELFEDEYRVVKSNLKVDEAMDQSVKVFMKEIEKQIAAVVDTLEEYEPDGICFEFHTDVNFEETDSIADNIIFTLIKLIAGENRAREKRLGVPKEFANTMMMHGNIIDCLNKELRVDVFNVLIYDEDGKLNTNLSGKDVK